MRCALFMAFVLVLSVAGCSGDKGKEATDKGNEATDKPGGEEWTGKEDARKMKGMALHKWLKSQGEKGSKRLKVFNDMWAIGKCYANYVASNKAKRPPEKVEEIKPFFETGNPDWEQRLRDVIQVVWKVPLKLEPDDEKLVLVYEREPDKDGDRLMETGGKLRLMTDAEFQAALKTTQGKIAP